MTVRAKALVVIAGLPGSGKSTLLRHTEADVPLVLLDSEQMRERVQRFLPEGTPYSRYRPVVHVLHRLRVTVLVIREPGPVVVHDPATGALTRTWLMTLGWLGRRSRHFLWVECSPEEAVAGQRHRGRMLRTGSFARHVRRLPCTRVALRNGLRGWHTTTIVDRAATEGGLRLTVCAPGPARECRSGTG